MRGNVSIHFVALDNMRRLRGNQYPLFGDLLKRLTTAFTELLNFDRVHDLDDVLKLRAIHCQTDVFSESYYVTLNTHHCYDLMEVTTTEDLLQTYGSTWTEERQIQPKSKFTCRARFSWLEQEY